jgi:secondary thiamine-phosphate synthase enzyme
VVHSATISVSTKKNRQLVDITAQVEGIVSESRVTDGLALVFTTHTTTGLYINEREGGLMQDVETVLESLVPGAGTYLHDRVDNNAASHIQCILLSPSLTVPITDGRLSLGTWQSIFLAERDGPRRRSVIVKVLGD